MQLVYHCSGLDQAILTDLDLMVNGYVRPETRTCTDFAVFTYEATGTDNHVIAQFNAGLNGRMAAILPGVRPSICFAS